MLSLTIVNTFSATKGIQVNDLYVNESGVQNDHTILFLHGSGASSNMWLKHIAELNSTFHCLAPDFPGHGRSNNTEWTNLNEVSDAIAELIKTKGHGKVHVVGLSLGGSVIYQLLERHPDLVDKAIIDGASAVPVKGSSFIILGVGAVSPFIKTRLVMKMMASGLGIPDDEYPSFKEGIEMVSTKSFRKAMAQANRQKIDVTGCRFASPTFFVSGEKESETMHTSHKILANRLPQSQCAYYPGKGHAWMVGDANTHIQLVKYWFLNDSFPGKLII